MHTYRHITTLFFSRLSFVIFHIYIYIYPVVHIQTYLYNAVHIHPTVYFDRHMYLFGMDCSALCSIKSLHNALLWKFLVGFCGFSILYIYDILSGIKLDYFYWFETNCLNVGGTGYFFLCENLHESCRT